MNLLMRSILVSLTLMLLMMQSSVTAADNLGPAMELAPPPPEIIQEKKTPEVKKTSPDTCISEQGLHALAQREISHQKCSLDLKTVNDAYTKHMVEGHPKLQFWQTPAFAVGAPLGAALVALLINGFIQANQGH